MVDEPWTDESLEALEGMNKGDVEDLVRPLANEARVHQEVRLLLAEMMDHSGTSKLHFRLKRRRGGRPQSHTASKFPDTKASSRIIRLLRSRRGIAPKTRKVLAEMLNPIGRSTYCFELGRRRPGKPGDTLARDMNLGVRVAMLVEEYGPSGFESAVAKAMKRTGLSRATVINAYTLIRRAAQRHQEDETP